VFEQRTRLIDIRGLHAHLNHVVDDNGSIEFVRDCIGKFYAFCAEPPVTFEIVLSPLLFQAAFCLGVRNSFRANPGNPA